MHAAKIVGSGQRRGGERELLTGVEGQSHFSPLRPATRNEERRRRTTKQPSTPKHTHHRHAAGIMAKATLRKRSAALALLVGLVLVLSQGPRAAEAQNCQAMHSQISSLQSRIRSALAALPSIDRQLRAITQKENALAKREREQGTREHVWNDKHPSDGDDHDDRITGRRLQQGLRGLNYPRLVKVKPRQAGRRDTELERLQRKLALKDRALQLQIRG